MRTPNPTSHPFGAYCRAVNFSSKSLKSVSNTVNPIKLETGLRPNSAGIPYTLPFRIEAIRFNTFGLLLYDVTSSEAERL